jgi:hypothetical protein
MKPGSTLRRSASVSTCLAADPVTPARCSIEVAEGSEKKPFRTSERTWRTAFPSRLSLGSSATPTDTRAMCCRSDRKNGSSTCCE